MNELTQSAGFDVLRQFARRERPAERCELCSAGLGPGHSHLIEVPQRRLLCACESCAILFSSQGRKFKRVPRQVRALMNFTLTEAEWTSLSVPINMAFFFHNSLDDRIVALYPSPAGATESSLGLEYWSELVARNPFLNEMQPDVEGLLINRLNYARDGKAEYFVLPIDECYKLTGLIRLHWKGLSGGAEVWGELNDFFTGLRERAIAVDVGRAFCNVMPYA